METKEDLIINYHFHRSILIILTDSISVFRLITLHYYPFGLIDRIQKISKRNTTRENEFNELIWIPE